MGAASRSDERPRPGALSNHLAFGPFTEEYFDIKDNTPFIELQARRSSHADPVSLLEAFQANFPWLDPTPDDDGLPDRDGAGVSAVLMAQRRARFDGQATVVGIAIRAVLCATCLYLPTAVHQPGDAVRFADDPELFRRNGGQRPGENRARYRDRLCPTGWVVGASIWRGAVEPAPQPKVYDPGLGGKALVHLVGVCSA